jgi:hypothetical protein
VFGLSQRGYGISITEHEAPFCYPQRHKHWAPWTCVHSLQMSFPFRWNQFIKTFVKKVNLRAQLVQDMLYTGLVARPQLWNQGFHPFHLKQVTNTASCRTQSFPFWYKLLWNECGTHGLITIISPLQAIINPLHHRGYYILTLKLCILPTKHIYVIHVILTTNSNYFPIQH